MGIVRVGQTWKTVRPNNMLRKGQHFVVTDVSRKGAYDFVTSKRDDILFYERFTNGDMKLIKDVPEQAPTDIINDPPHYKSGGMEAVDVIEAFKLDWHLGSAAKYLLRAGRKGDALEDLRKCKWFLERKIAQLENK